VRVGPGAGGQGDCQDDPVRLSSSHRPRRAAAAWLAVPLLAAAVSGCGETDPGTPAACLNGPAAYRQALAEAPGPVRLEGGVAISECLPRNQGAGPQEVVGRSLLATAAGLAERRADGDHAEAAALKAGYLVGAVRRGAEDSEGIHATLANRVSTSASNGLDGESARVRESYDRGLTAGLEDG
jgi:hypothetical protein